MPDVPEPMNRPSWKQIAGGAAVLGTGAILFGHARYRSAMTEAQRAGDSIAVPRRPTTRRFDPAELDPLPEVARRYLAHAIAPGTPLFSVALLEMAGQFLLGDPHSPQIYAMKAREVIRQPDEFVWLPRMNSGLVTISGSDGHVAGKAWTRFWMGATVPVAQADSNPDLIRSAAFRGAAEAALWLPTTLLPSRGATWEEAGQDQARVTIPSGDHPVTLLLTLNDEGGVQQVSGQRWSNANPDKSFRLQPFGGTILAERRFGGLTIPSEVAMGNHFGTEDYLPFFQARLTGASYR
jgi:hypothetical protein